MNKKEELKRTVLQQVDKISNVNVRPYVDAAFDEMYDVGCNTFNKWAMLLSQCSHESLGFKYKEENLNYSKKALLSVFGKYFTNETATKYERKPQEIANIVYGNRMGNRENEGWKYRGRGWIMLTGYNNYQLYGHDDNPDELFDPVVAFITAADFFDENNLWDSSERLLVKSVTRVINGGYHGLEDRMSLLKKFCDKPSYKLSANIKLGSRGANVLSVQETLVALGYLDAEDADGVFGKYTDEVVRKYQDINGLVVDGIVGNVTYNKMLKASGDYSKINQS
jgi:putative chitinase